MSSQTRIMRAALDGGDGAGLTRSFGIASLLLLLGVGAAWLVVKRVGDEPLMIEDDMLFVTMEQRQRGGGVQMLIEQAELAYAAGRILAPSFDSALYFYQAVLAEDPQHVPARLGLDRVLEWLRGELVAARAGGDLSRAEAVAAQIAALRPDDAAAREQARQAGRAVALAQTAAAALQAGELAAAGRHYQELATIPGAEIVARQGVERSLAAWVTQARTAANRGDLDQARTAAAAAAELGADGPTRASLREVIAEAATQAGDRLLEVRLAAAARALETGRLLGTDSAWALYGSVLEQRPDHAGAQGGVAEVRKAMLARLNEAISAERFDSAVALAQQAEELGVAPADLRTAKEELAYRQHLAAMREGRFGPPMLVSEMELLSEQAPVYPRQAITRNLEGWVDLEFTVTAEGRVDEVVVLDASAAMFHAPSVEAIESYRFAPHRLHGRPVPVRAALRFNYRM